MVQEGRQVERVNVWSINMSGQLSNCRLGLITLVGAPPEDVVGSAKKSEERGPPLEDGAGIAANLYLYNKDMSLLNLPLIPAIRQTL